MGGEADVCNSAAEDQFEGPVKGNNVGRSQIGEGYGRFLSDTEAQYR